MSILAVNNLSVAFETVRGPLQAVDNLSYELERGGSLGIVGESGSGKSVSSLAIMGLLPDSAKVQFDQVTLADQDISQLSLAKRRRLLGQDIAMIFQDPMSSLNPSLTVGFQIDEVVKRQQRLSRKARRLRQLELLDHVGIKGGERVLKSYPHELSGGMCQRVMIAMAIAGNPKILIADEPTTALDVTIQKQILDLIRGIQTNLGMGLILITHDIGVVAHMTHDLLVMYAGQAVERGPTADVIRNPQHPYTSKLLQCLPSQHHTGRLQTIPGLVPDLTRVPVGCRLAPRCEFADRDCRAIMPTLDPAAINAARCHHPLGGQHV